MKKVLIALVLLAVAVGVAVALVVSNIGSIIKAAVEKFGSDATGAKVTLAEADVSLTSGEGKLGGLRIANPKGFTESTAFELGVIKVQLDTASLSSDTIVVKEVLIQGPKVLFEIGPTLGSNLGKIQENVDAYTKSLGVGGGPAKPEEKPAPGGEKKFIIKNLWVRGGQVALGTAATSTVQVTSPLPEIHLSGIGEKSGGASAGEVTSQVIGAITSGALDVAVKSGIEKTARDAISGALKGVTNTLDGLFGGKK